MEGCALYSILGTKKSGLVLGEGESINPFSLLTILDMLIVHFFAPTVISRHIASFFLPSPLPFHELFQKIVVGLLG